MSLADLANIAEFLGVLAIVFGIAFGAIQLRQHRNQARSNSIVELANLLDDLPAKQLETLDGEYVSVVKRAPR